MKHYITALAAIAGFGVAVSLTSREDPNRHQPQHPRGQATQSRIITVPPCGDGVFDCSKPGDQASEASGGCRHPNNPTDSRPVCPS